ncbi:ATP-dependent helicase [Mesoterricola silvestris]|uniref:DNA 3'-5' helicase n=1 Tax=Mesoterricola silvestris TaxID=2927979 RepID=A0AA48GTL7_9BACT|nr:UvrD-helicase domain-containing protein [Mesoterricola silvestris]BDU73817.1 DNA helicase PcrA [Mesoterricola silvestris]
MPAFPPDHPLLRNLNSPQKEAVTHVDGPLLILAGAGSGKTTVITRRIAWLIEEVGVRPASILAMTFTNKAAGEMAERVQRMVHVPAEQLWVSTFHSFCTRILRREGDRTPVGRDFVIFDPSDQRSLVKQVLADLKLPEKQFHPRKVLEVISDFKNRCLLPDEAMEEALDPWTRKVLEAYRGYQNGLRSHKACDFDDLLLHTERLFRDPEVQAAYAERFKYILVDEYQDTNRVQYLLVQHLAKHHLNLCVVGDEDQSIYGWRGADIRNILDFKKDFPGATEIKLEQNYRSTQLILDAASTVIANNTQRLGKTLWTDLGLGERITFKLLDEGRLEAEYVVDHIRQERLRFPNARMAVLYRANWQSRQLEEALRAQNMPYKLVGGVKFYERQEVKDLLAYLRLVCNPFDLVSFRRSVNSPTRGVGATTLARIEAAIPEGGTALQATVALLRSGELKGRAQRELVRYVELFRRAEDEARTLSLSGLVRWVLVESGYVQMLEEEATLEAETRLRNLEEFVSAAAEAESLGLRLAEFLDRVSLASDSDELEEASLLSLMTIHCAKGLEFPVVFMVGMEEDVFPNRNAREADDGLEEERRLFYVAITRAQNKLYLTAARRRRAMGQELLGMPSRFLRELPEEGLESPIRWGTELYRSGQGNFPSQRPSTGGATSVASELGRIRSFFNQVRAPEPPADAAPEAPEPEEPRPAPSGSWPKGTRVLSPRFGRGVITAASGGGDMLTYTIRFPEGEKRIVARFGMLEKES